MQLIIPSEAAHETVNTLGEVGMLQFKDLNSDKSAFQRTYANQVKRCDEMLRKLRFFSDQINKAGLVSTPRPAIQTAYDLDELEAKLEELETELLEVNANQDKLDRSHSEMVELQLVLEKAGGYFEEAMRGAEHMETGMQGRESSLPLLDGVELQERGVTGAPESARLGFVAGVVLTEKAIAFERVLFRATRGNMFLKLAQIEGKVKDPTLGEKVEKSVFVVFFAGELARSKILKICEAFNANRYPLPEDVSRQQQMNAEVTARLGELHMTLEAGSRQRDSILSSLGLSLGDWTAQVQKEKAVYHTLNKLSVDVTKKCLLAEGWCPIIARRRVQEAIERATYQSSAQVGTIFKELETTEAPPTYFQTNKITSIFQEIVDAYGVARYREVNPAVLTIVTFPFLFAIMFGDLGHGLIMLLGAVFMVVYEKKLANVDDEIFQMAFAGRYCILLMAIFSLYTGVLYNEFFSMPMSLFGGSAYVCESDPSLSFLLCPEASSKGLMLGQDTPYPVGLDPVWHGSKTELQFTNSMKMKMSVIIGVIQMMIGIFMSALNHMHFKDTLSIWCEFVPQVLFLFSMFGYLAILIMVKWVSGTTDAPMTADLYHVMIYMFLSPGNVDCFDSTTGKAGCPENLMYEGQGGMQLFLVLVVLVCLPWMLLPKPLILRQRHQEKIAAGFVAISDDDDVDHGHDHEFNFGDTMVHQMIHTIEFALGAVSNTASYLRLWALSLAHAQLSAVFWDRILMLGIEMESVPVMVVCFFMWALATFGVLMAMESLSAFLHALRLHWVEFQNKFYHGDGHKFVPFSFLEILGSAQE